MNKSYTYLDGKVIVIDDNNHQVLKEYQDNIDEILKEENIVERMKNEIKFLNNKYDNLKNIKNKKFFPYFTPFMIGTVYLFSFIFFNLMGHSDKIVESIFGEMQMDTLMTNFIVCYMLIPTIGIDLLGFKNFKDKKKEFCATESKLEFLNKQIKEEEKKLSILKENKSREKENKEFRNVAISDKEKLQTLKYYLLMYEDLGKNFDKYSKYYEKGILEDKLKSKFYSDDISYAKDYIEEKQKVMVKK